MIKAEALKKSFRKKGSRKESIQAVSEVSFCAQDGRITGLLGANGAGKSTTLRMLVSLLSPDAGTATVDGWDIEKNKLEVRRSIGYLPHNSGVYGRLTARENVEYFAALTGMQKGEISTRVDELIELLGMQEFADRRTEGFSQGQRTKVALARALVHKPKNLVLDEPTNGLDVMATRNLRKILIRLREEGHCVLISSHIMQEITHLCDHVAIINDGRVVAENSVEGILQETGQSNFEDAFVVAIGESLEAE